MNQKNKLSNKVINNRKAIGTYGESVAVKYLKDKGYEILFRNYVNKIGELDIVCKKEDTIHVIEVKTVTAKKDRLRKITPVIDAEEHLDRRKIRKVTSSALLYMLEKGYKESIGLSIDSVLVCLCKKEGSDMHFPQCLDRICVRYIKNINIY